MKLKLKNLDLSAFQHSDPTTNTGQAECVITAKIMNPQGNRKDFSHNAVLYKADFYEYDDIYNISEDGESGFVNDPLESLLVPFSRPTIEGEPFVKNWSQEVFVRKGQVIRFEPESWNGDWLNGVSQNIECGIGMAMKIEERPAFLCKGKDIDEVANPLCLLTEDGSACQAHAPECFDETNSNTYCPIENCQLENGDPSLWDGGGSCEFSGTPSSCSTCFTRKQVNGSRSPNMQLILDQCYDLENYTGRVGNIDKDDGFSALNLGEANYDNAADAVVKGARILEAFDGYYGTFEGFTDSGNKDSFNNLIYDVRASMIFSEDARLKFVVLDGDNFVDLPNTFSYSGGNPNISYDNGATTAYNGSNGFKITLAGKQEFSSGEMLEVLLCEATNTGNCSGSLNSNSTVSRPQVVSDQPRVVE
ncbi:MAG: hypothetical protein O3B09_03175, partial [Proteobacteria bacterium]|nr:hypothetical protein [Pseudomonadota bacterium]